VAIITAAEVKRRIIGLKPYLDQVDALLKAEEGEQSPGVVGLIDENIAAATARFERELETCLEATVIHQDIADGEVQGVDYDLREPALDWDRKASVSLLQIKLRRRPVISVESIALKLSDDYPLFTFPPGWYEGHVQFNLGVISIVPVPVGDAMLSSTGQVMYQWLTGRMPYPVMPQLLRVNYTAGYADPVNDPQLAELRRHLANDAALKTLADVRDLLPSNVSIDGASEGFDTVQQRLEARQAEIDEFLTGWRERQQPAPLIII